ncbi:Uncharacterized protein OBRU01_07830 [Operophtera brumata]|uniref:Uncharacterized protein n=1 Tax=Operophtera brumata TaxID=104452 RepID=A0A0L7L4G9_OPEBR|nr:Uncharacterized protein OBRU01_07830 [Operophtera brumata]
MPRKRAVVVMGSSTTSDKTINTSTDSAATALTSITGTDDSMDAEAEPPEPVQTNLIDEPTNHTNCTNQPPNGTNHLTNSTTNHNPPSTAPPHYHRNQKSCEINSPAYTKPQSATDVLESPRPGPARFVFDVPMPDPKKARNKTQVSIGGPSTSIQIPPKVDTPKSPKSQPKLETHFDFDPEPVKRRGSEEPVKRRGSEPRVKNKQKEKEYYKDEMTKLRRQLEGTEVFTTNRRRSSAHQHSVPPPSARRQSTAAQVHVTANPLDSAATTIPAGRTTIVVQQPSLSLDYGGCSTILLREGEERLDRRKSRVCSDHIQQLLDVTSQFTSEDLHEFDKRYGSPHHSRSQSVKAGRSRATSQLLGLPQQRARVASMPNTGVEEEERGSEQRRLTEISKVAVEHFSGVQDSSAGLSTYRVLVLGAPGVGKSSLVGQFMTSEYLHAYDTSIDDESGERSVCVLLAGEESEITFLDAPPDHAVTDGCAHGYCVVYSTAERSSFAEAEKRLQALWAAGHTARRAVILVEGKALATSYECKFIETSVGINHNVDELLVGLLTQIRLKQQHAAARAERQRKRNGSRKTRNRARSPKEIEEPPPPPASAASTPRKRTRLSASVKHSVAGSACFPFFDCAANYA